jgi:hypothetical protein
MFIMRSILNPLVLAARHTNAAATARKMTLSTDV